MVTETTPCDVVIAFVTDLPALKKEARAEFLVVRFLFEDLSLY